MDHYRRARPSASFFFFEQIDDFLMNGWIVMTYEWIYRTIFAHLHFFFLVCFSPSPSNYVHIILLVKFGLTFGQRPGIIVWTS